MFRRSIPVLILGLTLPALVLAQQEAPTANAPQGAPVVAPPAPAPDNVSGPGSDRHAARKAIMDRMRECMKTAVTKDEKKVCRDEMRKSREAIHEAKKNNAPKKK